MTRPAPYEFIRSGRTWSTLIAVSAVWVVGLIGWLAFDIAPLVLGLLVAFTLPALWDLYSARMAGTRITPEAITWNSGPNRVTLPLPEIDHVRLVTRLDLSVRAAVVLNSGRKLRIPAEATPPADAFEAALAQVGIRSERHHFTFI